MQAMIDLLVSLERHEHTAQVAAHQMSPGEKSALEIRTELVRGTIPGCVLERFELTKKKEPNLAECPAALAMATLVSVYRGLSPRERHSMTSFFDLAGGATRKH